MAENRLSGLNVLLLAVTLLAVLFGVYGFIRPMDGGQTASRRNSPAETNDQDATTASTKPVAGSGNPQPHEPTSTSARKPVSVETSPPRGDRAADKSAEPVAATGGPSDHGDAAITGVVLSSEGKPVPGATVLTRRTGFDIEPPDFGRSDPAASRAEVARYLAQAQRESRTTTSDREGRFSVGGLDAKLAYDVKAFIEGVGRAEAERVAAGDNIRLILLPQSWLVGRVTGPDGAAVKEFNVGVYRRNREWEARQQSFIASDGRFRMECDAGVMLVEISASGFCQLQPAEVTIDAAASEQTFVMGAAAILVGTVRDKAGRPLAGARIEGGGEEDERRGRGRSRNWGGPRIGSNSSSTNTDSLGRYRLDTLAPREYQFTATYGEASETKPVTLSAGESTLDFVLESGVRIALKLKNTKGAPVDAGEIWFLRQGKEWIQAERLPPREPGLIELAGIEPGDYTLSVTAAGYPPLRRPVKLAAGEQTIELELPDGAMISGKVTSSTGGSITGTSVRLIKEGEDENQAWGTGRWAQVKADGTFRLGPVEPGAWSIDVLGADWRRVAGEKRSLVVGENTIDFSLNSGGSLSVKITDESGKPAPWAYVWVVSSSDAAKTAGANANQQGVAVISFVEPGDYVLHVSAQNLAAPTSSINVRNGPNEATVILKAPNCARITAVTPNSQAAKIGLAVGDLIVEYNNEKVNNWEDVYRLSRKYKSGEEVSITIERGGQLMSLNLKAGQIGIDGESAVR